MTGPGYGARCKACNSPHRPEIDARLLAGESTRAVSAWLAQAHGEQIPHQGLLNHRTEHCDARAAAASRVEATAPVFEAAVERIVADASVLDEVAAIALRTARALEPVVGGKDARPSMATVVAFNGALSNARAAVTDRHEMLHGKRVEVTGQVEPTDPETLHARLAEIVARAVGRPDPGAAGPADPGRAG